MSRFWIHFHFRASDWTPTNNNQLNNTNQLYAVWRVFKGTSSKYWSIHIMCVSMCVCIIFDRMEDGLICVSLLLNDKIIIRQRSRISVPICINFCMLRFLDVQPIFEVSRFAHTLTFDNTNVPFHHAHKHTHTHWHTNTLFKGEGIAGYGIETLVRCQNHVSRLNWWMCVWDVDALIRYHAISFYMFKCLRNLSGRRDGLKWNQIHSGKKEPSKSRERLWTESVASERVQNQLRMSDSSKHHLQTTTIRKRWKSHINETSSHIFQYYTPLISLLTSI